MRPSDRMTAGPRCAGRAQRDMQRASRQARWAVFAVTNRPPTSSASMMSLAFFSTSTGSGSPWAMTRIACRRKDEICNRVEFASKILLLR